MKYPSVLRRAFVLAALGTSWLAFSACGSGGGNGGSGSITTAEFSGTWTGTWVSANPAPEADAQPGFGGLSLQLNQQGKTLIGTCRFDGHACLADCQVACQVKGETVTGTLHSGPVQVEIRGYCSGPGQGQHHGNGSHHANGMAGTYEILSGPCAGQHGTIELGPGTNDAPGAFENGSTCIGELLLIEAEGGEPLRFPLIQHH